MPIQLDGALRHAPCPVPSCPACEPNTGSVHPNLSAKAARVERGRHCYAIKLVPGLTFPVAAFGSDGRRNTCLQFTRRSFKAQRFSRALIQAQRDLVEVRL